MKVKELNFEDFLEKNKENLIFLMPVKPLRKILFVSYTSSKDPCYIIPCRIDESRYKVKDSYKVTLVPTEEYKEEFESKSLYVSDLKSLIKEKIVHVYLKVELNGDLDDKS